MWALFDYYYNMGCLFLLRLLCDDILKYAQNPEYQKIALLTPPTMQQRTRTGDEFGEILSVSEDP